MSHQARQEQLLARTDAARGCPRCCNAAAACCTALAASSARLCKRVPPLLLFLDLHTRSDIRPVPDNQEVWANGEESLIIEIVERATCADSDAGRWGVVRVCTVHVCAQQCVCRPASTVPHTRMRAGSFGAIWLQ